MMRVLPAACLFAALAFAAPSCYAAENAAVASVEAGINAAGLVAAGPKPFVDIVCPIMQQQAESRGLPPMAFVRLIWRESRFNPKVRGRVGEIGLMQIRPLTAQEWAQSEARARLFEGNLFEVETNLRIGAWYLSKLLKRYARTDRPAAYALADYNAGRGNVLRWIKRSAETNGAAFVSQITYPGTQEYVRSILRRATRYEGSFGS